MKKITLLILLLCGLGKLYAQQNNNGTYNPNNAPRGYGQNNNGYNQNNNGYNQNNNGYNQNNNGYNQNNNGYYQNNNAVSRPYSSVNDSQIHIVDSTQEITADILPVKADPKIKNDRYYFWSYNKVIHSTQGGYSGVLLNGHYIAFYPDKNLKEEGYFKAGLKDGTWKTWNPRGDLTNVSTWDEGVEVQGGQSLWDKIPFINKNNQQQQATPAKGNNGNGNNPNNGNSQGNNNNQGNGNGNNGK